MSKGSGSTRSVTPNNSTSTQAMTANNNNLNTKIFKYSETPLKSENIAVTAKKAEAANQKKTEYIPTNEAQAKDIAKILSNQSLLDEMAKDFNISDPSYLGYKIESTGNEFTLRLGTAYYSGYAVVGHNRKPTQTELNKLGERIGDVLKKNNIKAEVKADTVKVDQQAWPNNVLVQEEGYNIRFKIKRYK